jgi:hypothetical protein
MLRAWVKGIGIVTALVGVSLFGLAPGISPLGDTRIFHNLADLGLFIECGLILIIVGTVIILLSFMIPSTVDIDFVLMGRAWRKNQREKQKETKVPTGISDSH